MTAHHAPPDDRTTKLEALRTIARGFDTHDLDLIMADFADDAVFESPHGSEAWGTRLTGRDAVREAFAGRFAGIPDVRYRQDYHFVDGDRGRVRVDPVRNDDRRPAHRGPRLRPVDVPRRPGRAEGQLLEDPRGFLRFAGRAGRPLSMTDLAAIVTSEEHV